MTNYTTADFIGNSFADTLYAINSGTTIESITLSIKDGEYDFKGAVINNLIIAAPGITVKNAEVKVQMTVKSGSNDCKFKNVRFISTVQPVMFEPDTSHAHFEKCVFRNNNSISFGMYVMNAGLSKYGKKINDKVMLTDCYFANYDAVIKAKREVNCSIINGWCESLKKVVYCDGDWTDICCLNPEFNANIVINGFDFEIVDYVLQARNICSPNVKLKTNANIVISGVLALSETALDSGIVDYEDGVVNLECNTPVTKKFKSFTTTSPTSSSSNISKAYENSYRVSPDLRRYTYRAVLKPNETMRPFDTMHVSRIWWGNNSVDIYLKKTLYDGSVYTVIEDKLKSSQGVYVDALGELVLKNTSSSEQTITFTVETNCILD